MDKKSVLLGVLFIAGGLGLMTWNGIQQSKAQQQRLLEEAAENEQALQQTAIESDGTQAPSPEPPAFVASETAAPPPLVTQQDPSESLSEAPEIIESLENDFIKVRFSSKEAAILDVVLKEYPAENPHEVESPNPVVLNEGNRIPALSLERKIGEAYVPLARNYSVESFTDTRIVFSTILQGGIKIRRSYQLSLTTEGPEPYTIVHQTEFLNETDTLLNVDSLFLTIGTAEPSEADYMGFNLNASFSDNGDYDTIPAKKFKGGGFIFKSEPKDFVEERGLIQWGAVKNQFFTTIFTPDEPADALIARGALFPPDPSSGEIPIGVSGYLEFSIASIPPQAVEVISGNFYVGPKEFDRLSKMGLGQEDVMQLSWFMGFFLGLIGFVAKSLLTLMSWIQSGVGNWGLAIILTTVVIRLFLWPLTAKAARASKRMQKLQKPLKEIQEKYRDNPQKLNQEMMGLWKKHKINPLSGCWPVLIQFPIFIAFFNLLRNSSDLRFAEFLWITDLSMPDATIPLGEGGVPFLGSAINVLPFIWLVSMHFQMKMMPQPSVDNSSAKIIKWMPFIFFPFTYYFSSGLVLYWTATNGFSIFQQWMTNRKKDAEDEAIEVEIAEMDAKKTKKAPTGPLISKKKKKKKQP